MKKKDIMMGLNQDLQIQKKGNGIELIPLKSNEMNKQYTLENILQVPCSVYFLNTNSALCHLNEQAAITCGHASFKSALGQTMFDITTKEIATRVVAQHLETLKTNKLKIVEEDILLNNSSSFQCITVLLPWYKEEVTAGVLGFSIIIGQHSISQTLSKLTELGLLNSVPQNETPTLNKLKMDKSYYSKREIQCLNLILKGKTTREIAELTNLSARTIEHYIENIKNKMGAFNKSDLIIKAIEYFK